MPHGLLSLTKEDLLLNLVDFERDRQSEIDVDLKLEEPSCGRQGCFHR